MTYEVIQSHTSEPGEALRVSKHAHLRWQRRPTAWSGWLYCEDVSGVHGWVPESWLTLEGDGATIDRDYDATELDINVGAEIEPRLCESGWLLGCDESGRLGWVPLECVRKKS